MAAHTVAAMEYDPLDQDQQDAQRTAKTTRQKLGAKQLTEDMTWLMSEAAGRRIVWRMLSESGVYQTSFDPAAMTMAFNEGRRSEGLRLLALVTSLCPDHYLTMMKEQAK